MEAGLEGIEVAGMEEDMVVDGAEGVRTDLLTNKNRNRDDLYAGMRATRHPCPDNRSRLSLLFHYV